jgi:hypothetical protein
LAVTGYSASASANAASDCRQEAKEYGIVDEIVEVTSKSKSKDKDDR